METGRVLLEKHPPAKRRKRHHFEEATNVLWHAGGAQETEAVAPFQQAWHVGSPEEAAEPEPFLTSYNDGPPRYRHVAVAAHDATLDCSLHSAVCSPLVMSIAGDDRTVRKPENVWRPETVRGPLELLYHPVFLQQIQMSLTGPRPTHSPVFPHPALDSMAPALHLFTASAWTAPCATDSVPLGEPPIQASAAEPAHISTPSSAPPFSSWASQWKQHSSLDSDSFLTMGGGESYPHPEGSEPSSSSSGIPIDGELQRTSSSAVDEDDSTSTQTPAQRSESGNNLDPSSECIPCQLVSKTSKKTIHHIACHRGKLINTVLFRQGGLQLTERWTGTTMRDVGDRCSPAEVHSIQVTLGICHEPLKLQVVSFTSRPGDVTARFWYVREGPMGDEVRRKKEIDPYCLSSIWQTADYFEDYIVANAIPSIMKLNTVSSDERDLGLSQYIIKRTYAMAIAHYHKLEDEFKDGSGKQQNQEKRLLHNLFILLFAMRHTTGSAFICGDNKLGMKPELKDETYPLFGKVSVPRMIVAQFDSINHTRILTKYGRCVLQDLESFVFRNQPRWWWTIYLSVFILLHEASFISADRYRHARNNHGTKFRYSIPGFVEELQDGCNNILMHWHYYNCKPWPDPLEPWNRHTHLMAELPSDQYDLVMETRADHHVKRQLDIWSRYKDNGALTKVATPMLNGNESPYLGSQTRFDWDHPLYWVSQMFEERWDPHPTYQREYVL
ncbi:hypothetical protein XA68_15738 [Ophiocordyceps unilateralis]|uniref:Uncharacterized protein n=1 Tax=Ophiocordyceps unilateralis TaxID=268505 RepID=A0A2A9P6I9_OPHUN|nr:hypothetical protein XA68_15738 [Ophiocordyceps unilateralis]